MKFVELVVESTVADEEVWIMYTPKLVKHLFRYHIFFYEVMNTNTYRQLENAVLLLTQSDAFHGFVNALVRIHFRCRDET